MEGVTEVARFTPDTIDAAGAALKRDGAVVIDDLVPAATIDRLRDAITRRHPEFADKALLTDFQDNGVARFIAPVAVTRSVIESGLLTHPALGALFAAALGEKWLFEAIGMLMAFPGAQAQNPHRDGPELFPETLLGRVLPPFALTVVVPLVDVGLDNGPTAVQPGSHRYDEASEKAEAAVPHVPRGSSFIWTFSTRHWGLANRTTDPRPALYMTAARPFWIDHRNFGKTARRKLIVASEVRADLGKTFARAEVID